MGDDEAFLRALDGAPADDLTRLVYADWLDETGRPAEAEYLRLVCELTAAPAAVPDGSPVGARLAALGEGLPTDWRARAAGRFDAVLLGYEVHHKIAAIKVLREITGLGLRDTKELSEAIPAPFLGRVPYESAATAAARVCSGGNSIRTVVRPTGQPLSGFDARYRLVGYVNFDPTGRRSPTYAIPAFTRIVHRIAGPDAAVRTYDWGAQAVLADDIPADALAARLAELRTATRKARNPIRIMPFLSPTDRQRG